MTSTVPPRTKNLGPKLIAFILGTDVEQVKKLLRGECALTETQIAVVLRCEATLSEIAKGRSSNLVLEDYDVMALGTSRRKDGRTTLSGLKLSHETCGVPVDDAVERTMSEMCAEYFPFTLLPNNSLDRSNEALNLYHFSFSHLKADFVAAVRADASIMKLFPDGAPDDNSTSPYVYTSFGDGSNIRLDMLHVPIIQAAVALMQLHGLSSVAALQENAIQMLRALRQVAEGEVVKLPVVETYDLMGLPADIEIPVGDGILKAMPEDFVKTLPRGSKPAKDFEKGVFGCMLLRDSTFSTFIAPTDHRPESVDEWPVAMTRSRKDEFDVVSLATGLALDEATAARPRAIITIDPLNGIGQSWRSSSISLGRHHFASVEECKRLRDLLSVMEGLDTKPIHTAAKRFVGASINRADVEDSLIDAVIGLESLFGSRAEIAFQVSTGVSRLLGKDAAEREEKFKSTKQIYDARSKIVHGSQKELSKIDVRDVRERALADLKKCLTTLLESRQDLLALDTTDRVRTLVLSD